MHMYVVYACGTFFFHEETGKVLESTLRWDGWKTYMAKMINK